jgi:methanogenic corrinoid protein MtbC1
LPKLVSEAIDAQRQELAEEAVSLQYALQAERWEPFGSIGRDKSVRDEEYHLSYLSEALAASDPSLWVDYVAWVKVLFDNLGFHADALETTLKCTAEVLSQRLPEDMWEHVKPYLEAGLSQAQAAPSTVPSFLQTVGPLGDLARQYLEMLLEGERRAASGLILSAVKDGTPIKDIYLYVFQTAQREVGRLWQTNQISVAQEHYCTAATQLIMSQLYPHIFATERVGRRMVATCVGGELHEIGVRMVADFFEMEGWDTYYLGANTPTASILQALDDRSADMLAISATMTFHVGQVEQLIGQVRASSMGSDLQIMVGGYPFNLSPNLWRHVGADGFATDAQDAVRQANELLVRR